MTITEETVEFADDEGIAENLPHDSEGKFVVNGVRQAAAAFTDGFKSMRMLPVGERSLDLAVDEAEVGQLMKGNPLPPQGSQSDLKDSHGSVLNLSGEFDDPDRFPWRTKFFEGSGFEMPITQKIGRRVNDG